MFSYVQKFITLIILLFVLLSCTTESQENQPVSTREITLSVFEKGLQHCDIDFYAGTLMLHGMSEFALLDGNHSCLDSIVPLFEKFNNGEIQAKGNFISYEAGGSGAAYLSWENATNKLDQQITSAAKKLMNQQKRTHDNLMTTPLKTHKMFIDVVFAVSPFLLYSGLKFDKPEYVDYAVFQTLESFRILKDKKTGLLHQGRGFKVEGEVSEDNWSRGNGWGAFAISILARDLPALHPKRKEVIEVAQQFFTAVLNFQNEEGLWNQEMTDSTSYVETSGSGLMLYGLGIMLEAELLDKKYIKNFKIGLRGYTSYIGTDGSVSHTCSGCLCPKNGTKEDYANHPWIYNDHHAFGPVILAFTQAAKMEIDEIIPLKRLGFYSIIDTPKTPITYVTTARKGDIAWENDRVAFRLFGPGVRDKVGSGIDIWAKSVDYPILDNWYKLNAQGDDYHIDRGEGCDFYNMGKLRGCGGTAIWIDKKPYISETYDRYRIRKNQNDGIEFDLVYETWNVPEMKIVEIKKIQMESGTNFFKVTSTLQSNQDKELVVGIGLTTFGNPEVYQNKKLGILSVWEQIDEEHGNLGTAVLINPDDFVGFKFYNGDQYILIKVKTNEPFSYYAGAGWDGSNLFKQNENWISYINDESKEFQL